MGKPSFLTELRRRHVFRVAIAYVVTAWLLLQLGSIVFPTLHAPSWCEAVLLVFLVLGFPVAVLLAWAFEVTPEGVRRTITAVADEARSPTTGRRIGRTLDFAIIAILAAAVGVLLWRQFGWGRPSGTARVAVAANALSPATTVTAAPPESIAVLPFVNDSGDPNQRYFSDGLTEDLIIAFSQYHGLKVIGRESSFQLRDTKLDSREIGEKLRVTHLLEGSVSRAGSEVRVRAELVNAADGSTLWSQHYDRPYKDLFALQDDITRQVATALKAKLLGGVVVQTDRPPSGNLKAYNAYLEGNHYLNQFSEPSFRQAIAAYRQAIEFDPDYAAAYAQLSFTWSYLGRYTYSRPGEVKHAFKKARSAADTAVKLAPNLAAAHLARGYSMWSDLKWEQSEPEFKEAYDLAPGSSDAERLLAASLQKFGRLNESIALLHRAIAANPLDSRPYYDLSLGLFGIGKTDAAIDAIGKAISLAPTAAAYHAVLAWYDAGNGQPAAALRAAEAEPSPRFRNWALAIAYAAEKNREKADAALQQLIVQDGDLAPYFVADAYAFRDQPDDALEWLNRACRLRDPLLEVLVRDPYLLRYRNHRHFASDCGKAGIEIPVNRTDRI